MARTKYTPETANQIITALSVGATDEDASLAAGISAATFYNWQKRHVEFFERVTRAKPQGRIGALAVIRRAALDGDWRAAGDFLDRTCGSYRKSADTQISVTIDMRKLAEQVAHEYGLNPDDVIAEAEAIVNGAR